jgi:Zn-dependent peptidase ImmA (M78 family)
MRAANRAIRTAETILAKEEAVRLPVDVKAIAKQYAHVMPELLPADISGMLVPAPAQPSKPWIILFNRKQAVERQRFSIAHELGHLLLHEYKAPHADGAPQVRYRNTISSLGTDQEEVEANQFAAELLMPANLLIPRFQQLGLTSWNGDLADSVAIELRDLAADCKVSEQAMLLRVGNLLQHG